MNRVYIKTYGCQMNERDSEAVAALLRARGYSVVDEESGADVVLLNTCSVRDLAEQRAIGKAGYLAGRKKRDPAFVLGVMGCMAQNRGVELLDRLPDLDLLVGTQKFHRVPEMLDRLVASAQGLGPRPRTLVELDEEAGSEDTIRHHAEGRQVSAYVSIMQGCNMRCAFCIVPRTRGPERSRPMESVLEEVEALVARGVREVTLLGQIVTSYGRGLGAAEGSKSPFVQLLERLHAIEGLARIRFTSPHPRGFGEDLIAAFRDLPKLGAYAHLPMQSGSDKVLRAMRRPYSLERYRRIVRGLREAVPDMCLSTDVIVGFPGEEEEDFEATCAAFEEFGFEMAFVFKYSPRSGTPAADWPDLAEDVKEARNQRLLDLLHAQSLRCHRALEGSVQEVLVEGPAKRGEGLCMGRTRHYRKVVFPAPATCYGQLVRVRIVSSTVTTLGGQLEPPHAP